MILAVAIWTVVLIEMVVIARMVRRSNRRHRAWRNSPHAIPRRDLRKEYRR